MSLEKNWLFFSSLFSLGIFLNPWYTCEFFITISELIDSKWIKGVKVSKIISVRRFNELKIEMSILIDLFLGFRLEECQFKGLRASMGRIVDFKDIEKNEGNIE